MTANTAAIVLASCSLRWSSPVLFNDPFDVPRELAPNISPKDLRAAVARKMVKLIENPPTDTSRYPKKLQLILETVKNGIDESLRNELVAGLVSEVDSLDSDGESIERVRTHWRSLIPDMRILCLTESPFHIAMWYHYSEKYSGVVLELRCLDELDSSWLAAKKVEYPEIKPGVYTLDGWAELTMLKPNLAAEQTLKSSMLTKSPDWGYEREWRIASHKRETDSGDFTDYKFDPRELAKVYLGPLINPNAKNEIVNIALTYPDIKIIQVSIGHARELLFEEMKFPQ